MLYMHLHTSILVTKGLIAILISVYSKWTYILIIIGIQWGCVVCEVDVSEGVWGGCSEGVLCVRWMWVRVCEVDAVRVCYVWGGCEWGCVMCEVDVSENLIYGGAGWSLHRLEYSTQSHHCSFKMPPSIDNRVEGYLLYYLCSIKSIATFNGYWFPHSAPQFGPAPFCMWWPVGMGHLMGRGFSRRH